MADEDSYIIGGIFGAVGVGLILLFAKLLRPAYPQQPAQGQPQQEMPRLGLRFPAGVTAYGAKWEPGRDPQIRAIGGAQEPAGVYVCVTEEHLQMPMSAFDDAQDGIEVLFPTPPASAQFVQLLSQVTTNANILARNEAYINYAYKCLNYINGTAAGAQLLAAINQSTCKTKIMPNGTYGCSASGCARCSVTELVREQELTLGALDRQVLIARLEQVSQRQGREAFQWLADGVNNMPLYSVYEEEAQYPPRFLTTQQQTVTAAELEQWFETGNQSQFARTRKDVVRAQVKILNFVKNAVIILLYPGGRNAGCDTHISLDVRTWANNTRGVPTWWNSAADRPPAIGLAHELCHAYHNVRGDQPGRDFNDATTTLFELISVGLGPWANIAVSENAIRAQWPPHGFANDDLNLRQVPRRTIYETLLPNEQAVDVRKPNRAI